ncbi:hypothetical protein PI125_g20942 [Phytophthora idaei]|nr:hypothetical protein PI125_g20942 [Phytophthora idaei]
MSSSSIVLDARIFRSGRIKKVAVYNVVPYKVSAHKTRALRVSQAAHAPTFKANKRQQKDGENHPAAASE